MIALRSLVLGCTLSLALASVATAADLELDVQGAGVGQDITFTFTGPPGEQYLTIVSLTTGPTCLPNICLDVDLNLVGVSVSLPGFFDFYPPSGTVSLTYPIPDDPVFSALPPINFQTVLIEAGGGIVDKSNLYRVTFGDPGQFTSTIESMSVARAYPLATELDDGRVMIIGGGDGDLTGGTGLNSCEAYSRNLESFAPVDSMNRPRFLHAIAKLPDGRVMAIGGLNASGIPLASAEIYDPTTDQWTLTSGNMAIARAAHTASTLPDGRVMVSGGTSDFSDALNLILAAEDSTEIFDPNTGTFSGGPSMAEPKLGHTATTLANGDVLLSGGYTYFTLFGIPVPDISDHAQVYFPNGGSGSLGGEINMRDDRFAHSAVLLDDGRVLLSGGAGGDPLDPNARNSSEVFNPGAGSFSTTGNMGQSRAAQAAVLLPDGMVLVAGGVDGSIFAPAILSSAEVWDPNSGTYHGVGDLGTTRSIPAAILLGDNTVLVAGGAGGPTDSSLSTAEIYQPE